MLSEGKIAAGVVTVQHNACRLLFLLVYVGSYEEEQITRRGWSRTHNMQKVASIKAKTLNGMHAGINRL